MQQMYLIACVLGAGLLVVLQTQAPAILALMGAGPGTALFKEASAYLKVDMPFLPCYKPMLACAGQFLIYVHSYKCQQSTNVHSMKKSAQRHCCRHTK